MKKLGAGLLALLSVLTSLALVQAFATAPATELSPTYAGKHLGIYLHIFAAAVALLLGPFQFSAPLRRSLPRVHRWAGRLYLGIGVLIGGLAGLYMSFNARGGLPARTGFALMASLWLYTGLQAFLTIRRGAVAEHRTWMVRNFSLTFGAVTLRLYLPLAGVLGYPFDTAYPFIAWISWLPNIVVAEWFFNRQRGSRSAASRPIHV
jgi:uncharacterized membrane protein